MMNLMKIKRLVDGDDMFGWRVEAACWQVGVEYTKDVLKYVAADEDVLATTNLTPPDTIDSTEVPDGAILDAVEQYKVENPVVEQPVTEPPTEEGV